MKLIGLSFNLFLSGEQHSTSGTEAGGINMLKLRKLSLKLRFLAGTRTILSPHCFTERQRDGLLFTNNNEHFRTIYLMTALKNTNDT